MIERTGAYLEDGLAGGLALGDFAMHPAFEALRGRGRRGMAFAVLLVVEEVASLMRFGEGRPAARIGAEQLVKSGTHLALGSRVQRGVFIVTRWHSAPSPQPARQFLAGLWPANRLSRRLVS